MRRQGGSSLPESSLLLILLFFFFFFRPHLGAKKPPATKARLAAEPACQRRRGPLVGAAGRPPGRPLQGGVAGP